MKSLFAVLSVLGLVAVANASVLTDVGTAAGNFNLGTCLAFQDDQTDTTTTCYTSCGTASTDLADMFDVTNYSDSSFNAAELLQFAQVFAIAYLTQMEDCGWKNILYQLDTMMSDLPQTLGSLSNVGTQIATCVTYYFLSGTTSDLTQTQDTFGKLFVSTAYYKLISQIVTYYTDSDYTNIGLVLASTFKTLINYSSPNYKA